MLGFPAGAPDRNLTGAKRVWLSRHQADTVNVGPGPGHRYDGAPAQRIEMEERPRNTCENGLESAFDDRMVSVLVKR